MPSVELRFRLWSDWKGAVTPLLVNKCYIWKVAVFWIYKHGKKKKRSTLWLWFLALCLCVLSELLQPCSTWGPGLLSEQQIFRGIPGTKVTSWIAHVPKQSIKSFFQNVATVDFKTRWHRFETRWLVNVLPEKNDVIHHEMKPYKIRLNLNECRRDFSGIMGVQRLSIRLSCCVRSGHSPPSAWTQTSGASTFSRTPDPPLTSQRTRLSWSLMTASWVWICPMEDSEWTHSSHRYSHSHETLGVLWLIHLYSK